MRKFILLSTSVVFLFASCGISKSFNETTQSVKTLSDMVKPLTKKKTVEATENLPLPSIQKDSIKEEFKF